MPKLAHHVTLEVFTKAHDSVASAYRCLDFFAPVPMKIVLETQWKWHPEKKHTKVYDLQKKGILYVESETPGEDGALTVHTYRFDKQRDVKAFVDKVQELPKDARQGLLNNIENNLDSEGKLKLKFDKKALAEGKLLLGGTAEKVMARINLAAYPKNWDSCVAVAREILGDE